MLNLLKNCLSGSRLGSKAISKTLPFGVLSSKPFIANPKTPFLNNSIKYYFWEQNISRKDQNPKHFLNNQQLSVLIGFICLVASYYYYISNSQEFKQKALAKKHKNGASMKKGTYLKGSTIENEIKGIIDRFVNNKIKMIVGCPGLGKTTALKKILTQREENSEFYFFTLQSIQDQADCEEAARNLLTSLYGIKKLFKGSTLSNKKIKIIIDDINRLLKLKDQGLAQRIMTLIYTFSQSQSLDLICISSSSTFVEVLQLDSQHKKSVKTFIIQSQHSEEFINSVLVSQLQQKYLESYKKRLVKSQNFWRKFRIISKQVFDYGFTPRFIEDILSDAICDQIKKMEDAGKSLNLVQDKKEQYQINEILKIVQQEKKSLANQIMTKIDNFNPSNLQNYKKVLRLMNQHQSFSVKNCGKTNPYDNKIPLFNNMIEYLNKQDLIMFCRPRTKIERIVFEQYIKYQKKN